MSCAGQRATATLQSSGNTSALNLFLSLEAAHRTSALRAFAPLTSYSWKPITISSRRSINCSDEVLRFELRISELLITIWRRLRGRQGALPSHDTLLPEQALSRVPDTREAEEAVLQHGAIVPGESGSLAGGALSTSQVTK